MAESIRVQAILTAPRYENTWCRTIIEAGLRKLGIPLNVGLGVFYGQNMQRMMEDAIDAKIDYIVTIDGDTTFTSNQLHRLISVAHQEKLPALCGMQVRRGKPWMLGFKEGTTSAMWDGYPIQVDAAHFGLTVINCEALAKVAKPWFICVPDEDGRWGEGRTDSDVWFWKQWKEAGNALYIDPGVRLGHMEEMIVIHDETMEPKHVYPKEWEVMMKEQEDREKEKAEHDQASEGVEEVSSRACV